MDEHERADRRPDLVSGSPAAIAERLSGFVELGFTALKSQYTRCRRGLRRARARHAPRPPSGQIACHVRATSTFSLSDLRGPRL